MLTDAPVAVTPAADLLGQRAVIRTLTTAIEGLPAPACVAVYGPWGSGKTNIMHNAMLAAEADLHVPVWFDPWQYDQQPDLLGPLIRALLLRFRARCGHDPDRAGAFVKAAAGLARSLGAFALRVGARAAVNSLLPLPIGDDGKPIFDAASGDTSKMDIESWLKGAGEPEDEVARIKAEFKALVDATLVLAADGGAPRADRRVIFFLDDLDRCLPDRVLVLIEKVKLLLCGAPGCQAIFVFALDRRIVGEAIRNQFPGASQYTGENYLEKIFDCSIEAPPVPADPAAVRRFVEHCAAGLGGLEPLCAPFGGPEPLLQALTLPPLANPRVIKRTLNRVKLLLADPIRRDAIAGLDGAPFKGLIWLAGAERFRVVRHLIRSTDGRTVGRLIERLRGGKDQEALLDGTEQLVSMPGLLAFLEALGLTNNSALVVQLEQFAGAAPVQPGALKWFDDLMRSAGL